MRWCQRDTARYLREFSSCQRPPLFTWLAADYPSCSAPLTCTGACGYTLSLTAEADDLEVTHPLHTLRRLIDAPLPLPAAGLP